MTHHDLPPTLDLSAAEPLRHRLAGAVGTGGALSLDGAGVERVGYACLQVLASARATALAHGTTFRLAPRSAALAQMIAVAGFDAALADVA